MAIAVVLCCGFVAACSYQAIDDLVVMNVAPADSENVLPQLQPYYADGLRKNPAILGFLRVDVATQDNVVLRAVNKHANLRVEYRKCDEAGTPSESLGLPGVYMNGNEPRLLALYDVDSAKSLVPDDKGRYVFQVYLFQLASTKDEPGDVCLHLRGSDMLSTFYSNEVRVPR